MPGGQATPLRKGIDLILHAATVPARAFPTARAIASEGVYQNGAARRMGLSIPLHLDWTVTSNHRIGKYSARLPEPASEGENGRSGREDFNAQVRTLKLPKNISIMTHYAASPIRAESAAIQDIDPSGRTTALLRETTIKFI